MFRLDEVVPWGRSFDEYVAMFALSVEDLEKRIVGCGDGPASFNVRLTRQGGTVVSVDPLYRWSADEIRERIRQVTPIVLEQTRLHARSFVWNHIGSVEELARVRRVAMDEFLVDYESSRPARCGGTHRSAERGSGRQPRYVDAALPELPFPDSEFDIALCSHFLFLYSEQHSFDFHLESLIELARVAREVRVFPLLELSGVESRHLNPVVLQLAACGYVVTRQRVPYEFQRGGNEMLFVRRMERR